MKPTPTCRAVRRRLTAGEDAAPDRDHLTVCTDCRQFAHHLASAREELRSSGAEIEPPPGFAARVMGEIAERRQGPAETLGWAAIRLMPAAVALAAGLGWLAAQAPLGAVDLLTGDLGDDALLTWMVLAPEEPAGAGPATAPAPRGKAP